METLPGTRPFGHAEVSWNNAFADHYAKQWARTVAWLQQALRQAAVDRDRERRTDEAWLRGRRQTLRRLAGLDLFTSEPREVRVYRQEHRAAFYTVAMANGLTFAGALWLPAEVPAGLVILADPGCPLGSLGVAAEAYLRESFCVVQPFLAREVRTFRENSGEDHVKSSTGHPGRRWYAYEDHELIHFFAFVVGGALAGLEAWELRATTEALETQLGLCQADGSRYPLVVDVRGRWTLTGAVAAALYPRWASLLVLHEEAYLLDHQDEDVRANTLWGFHRHFDGLTLLQLAEGTAILFAEHGSTPTAQAARALAWFTGSMATSPQGRGSGGQVPVPVSPRTPCGGQAVGLSEWGPGPSRVVGRCGPAEVAAVARQLLGSSLKIGEGAGHGGRQLLGCWKPGDAMPAASHLYRGAVESKVAFLEAEHEKAVHRRAACFQLSSLTPEAYRARVREALEAVMGPPLPRAPDPRVRTRRIPTAGPYALYEVVMESVPGVDVAGYLLIPAGQGPWPAVICQHGLLGRPEELVGLQDNWIYDRIARTLAEKGYVTFAPFMNWGWGGTPARDTLAKHAYALGITPNRFEAAQLGAIVDFLQSRPEVLPDRIAFYGLSYGGHASIWLGACEERLAAVVTAGHFNDWARKLTSTEISPPLTRPTSYITVEEGMDMFTFDVLNQLGHAELVTLHAPRPYMVENGLRDAVTPTAWVEGEFARVRQVYEWLGASDRVELAHFDGPHRIWGEESLVFLRRHLYGESANRRKGDSHHGTAQQEA